MKVYLILSLLMIGTRATEKISLESIETDNLRAEDVSNSGNAQSTKYPIKEETNQQQYQIPSKYSGILNSYAAYVTPPSIQNVPPEAYIQPNRYNAKQQSYQQNNNNVQEQALPQQYYAEYQQQPPIASKGITRNTYETKQLVHQPEVILGNYWQSVQQRVASAKIPKNVNRETVYLSIPMMHLLTYYPNLELSPGKSNGHLTQPALTTATQQISIPLYSTSTFNQKPIIPLKPTYQIQYTPKHTAVPSDYTTKNAVYTTPVTSKKVNSGPVINLHTYNHADQSVAQGRQFLYTQAYITPTKQQYVPQLVYAQPTTDYIHATPVYNDVYAREPQYMQDNSLHGSMQYASTPEQSEPATTGADEQPKQVLSQETSQTVSQNYVQQDPEELSTDLVPPQLPPQDFHSEVTPLTAVPSQDEETISVQNHVEQSVPRSLLDSYVPSKIIAAQDSIRYQERPIKLESGFLPSKENFLYKKRKTE